MNRQETESAKRSHFGCVQLDTVRAGNTFGWRVVWRSRPNSLLEGSSDCHALSTLSCQRAGARGPSRAIYGRLRTCRARRTLVLSDTQAACAGVHATNDTRNQNLKLWCFSAWPMNWGLFPPALVFPSLLFLLLSSVLAQIPPSEIPSSASLASLSSLPSFPIDSSSSASDVPDVSVPQIPTQYTSTGASSPSITSIPGLPAGVDPNDYLKEIYKMLPSALPSIQIPTAMIPADFVLPTSLPAGMVLPSVSGIPGDIVIPPIVIPPSILCGMFASAWETMMCDTYQVTLQKYLRSYPALLTIDCR